VVVAIKAAVITRDYEGPYTNQIIYRPLLRAFRWKLRAS
jgi:hypothetical protein